MKKLLIYIKTFLKTFFRQIFDNSEIAKVEKENILKKVIIDTKLNKPAYKKLIRKNNGIFGRTTDALPRIGRPCLLCKEDMMVSIGQIAYWHGKCRSQGRNRSKFARYGRV